jgi:hypothetical protein
MSKYSKLIVDEHMENSIQFVFQAVLGIKTQNKDDNHTLSVEKIKEALELAYVAGRKLDHHFKDNGMRKVWDK